jgi:hypothetical protein
MSPNLLLTTKALERAASLYEAIERHVNRLDDNWACYASGLYLADIAKKEKQLQRTLDEATEHVSNAETAHEFLNGIPTTEFWEKIFIKADETRILMTRLQHLIDK